MGGPRCCAASGYYCFKNSNGRGQCMKECTPGGMNGTCEGVAPHMRTGVESPGVSLFCFSVYTADTGSEKPSHELELLQMQHENAWNVFSCTEWAIYSDVVVPLGGGDMTTDGACEADRPAGQEKNKKYIPNCEGVSTPSIHPFKKPEAYAACWAQASSVPLSGLRAGTQ